MTFTSYTYLGFLLAVLLLYYFLPARLQNVLLLTASFVFYYILQPGFLWLLLATGLYSYLFARVCGVISALKLKKAFFILSLFIVIAPLFIFKYLGFFDRIVAGIFSTNKHFISLALPLGISFYTFQILGYMIDVYRGKTEPEKDPVKYLLFVSFFPQLMSGPIGRSGSLLPQYSEKRKFSTGNLGRAAARYLCGIFKKAVIADNIGLIVDTYFASPSVYGSILPTLSVIAMYALQIYFDFAGYSDMAIASADLFGIRLPENFDTPYLATNISGFWKRWHMSLTGWLTEYIYIPLGGNRKGKLRKDLNILVVFLVSGLWHGADYTFIVWGLLHGIYRVGEEILHEIKPAKIQDNTGSVRNLFKMAVVFGLTAFAFLFFRSTSIGEAFEVLGYLGRFSSVRGSIGQISLLAYTAYGGNVAATKLSLAILAVSLVAAFILDIRQKVKEPSSVNRTIPVLTLPFSAALLLMVLMYLAVICIGVFGASNFIYFQF